MITFWNWLDGKKTYLVALGVVFNGAYGFLMGDFSMQEAMNYVFAGLGLGAMRKAL